MTGTIFDIKEMALHDGPGLRTTVFLKGCPLSCIWCHNPEGISPLPQLMFKEAKCVGCKSCEKKCDHSECRPFGRCIHTCPENCLEISGKITNSADLAKELKKSAEVLGSSFGGFTFSGGEPLAQPDFLLELSSHLKPLIPDITDTKENLSKIREIIGDSRWEQLPFNTAAGAKYKMLSMEFKMK